MKIRKEIIRQAKTAWIEEGQDNKTILFFMHGCPDTAEDWKYQIEYFAKDYHVIAPFGRGIGESADSSNSNRYTFESVALDNLKILSTCDPSLEKPVVLVAHDLGGVYAWYLARLLRERLRGLILINSADVVQLFKRFKNPKQFLKSWYIFFFQIPIVSDAILKKYDAYFTNIALRKGRKSREIPQTSVVSSFLPFYRAAFLKGLKYLVQTPQKIKAPVLVISSRKDAFLEIPENSEFKGLCDSIEHRVVDAYHWVHLEQPNKVNNFIYNFLEKSK